MIETIKDKNIRKMYLENALKNRWSRIIIACTKMLKHIDPTMTYQSKKNEKILYRI